MNNIQFLKAINLLIIILRMKDKNKEKKLLDS